MYSFLLFFFLGGAISKRGFSILRMAFTDAIYAFSFGTMGSDLLETMKLLKDIDTNGDGELTKEEYLEAAKKIPLLLASIYVCI
jgi:hypothetical protein